MISSQDSIGQTVMMGVLAQENSSHARAGRETNARRICQSSRVAKEVSRIGKYRLPGLQKSGVVDCGARSATDNRYPRQCVYDGGHWLPASHANFSSVRVYTFHEFGGYGNISTGRHTVAVRQTRREITHVSHAGPRQFKFCFFVGRRK